MKKFLCMVLLVLVSAGSVFAADQGKDADEMIAVMEKIVSAVKTGDAAAVKPYFEEMVMISEPGVFARKVRSRGDYDGFSSDSGIMYAVFFDTMKLRSLLRPYVKSDHYYCLRDAFSKGEPAQGGYDMDRSLYIIVGKYNNGIYKITLRKNGSAYKIIIINLPAKK